MSRGNYLNRLSKLEEEINESTGQKYSTVFGIVSDPGDLIRSVKYSGNSWIEVEEKPNIYIAEKLEKVLYSKKRIVVVIGGRGSAKSVGVHDIVLSRVRDRGDKAMCMREFQSSIDDSVHALLKEEIERLVMNGFDIQEKRIFSDSGGSIRYRGLARNPSGVKSAAGFNIFCVEEADNLSSNSIKTLTPTARNKSFFGTPSDIDRKISEENEIEDKFSAVQMFFIANPKSQADPFSQRFINPYLDELISKGIYEDDLHLIVMMNCDDNPWYRFSGLEAEREHDKANCSPAMYRHIWEGGFLDEVEDSIISQDWFNAAIDAHVKLGFKPTGAKVVAFDPADTGNDAKAITYRQGSVILDARQTKDGDFHTATLWACDFARDIQADHFVWDGGGMGATLRNEITRQLAATRIEVSMFNGAAGVRAPDAVYLFENKGVPIQNSKPNKDTFSNLRAQKYWELRDRFYATYRAVAHGELTDPDKLISISSKIEDLDLLRAEMCRIPRDRENNGKIKIMGKDKMREKKLKSPNMADSAMMSLDIPDIMRARTPTAAPRPIQRFPTR
jgi:phage terminase large subunit